MQEKQTKCQKSIRQRNSVVMSFWDTLIDMKQTAFFYVLPDFSQTYLQ